MGRRGRGRKKRLTAVHPIWHGHCNHGKVVGLNGLLRPALKPGKKRVYTCNYEGCEAHFSSLNNFCDHQLTLGHFRYPGWVPIWRCRLCKWAAVTKHQLFLHIRDTHACSRCGKVICNSVSRRRRRFSTRGD